MRVTKGHGTGNDFVLIDDRDGALEMGPDLVRALADRHTGVGGDGVIRVAPDPAGWFMDYRNADGSPAEMCGNGVRVFAAFARRLGLWDGTGELAVVTRAGPRPVRRVADPTGADADWYTVSMGRWHLPGGPDAVAGGGDAEVRVAGVGTVPGLRVDVGTPHTVVVLPDDGALVAADLSGPPVVAPTPPDGTNVELVVPLGESAGAAGPVGELRMRVHERGVGETRSCGTGAVAAAVAAATWAGAGAPADWWVRVPGGTLQVTLSGDRADLAGPAVLVADLEGAPAALTTPTA